MRHFLEAFFSMQKRIERKSNLGYHHTPPQKTHEYQSSPSSIMLSVVMKYVPRRL